MACQASSDSGYCGWSRRMLFMRRRRRKKNDGHSGAPVMTGNSSPSSVTNFRGSGGRERSNDNRCEGSCSAITRDFLTVTDGRRSTAQGTFLGNCRKCVGVPI